MTFCTKQGLQICRAYVTTKHLKLQCGLVNLTVFTSSAYVRNFSSYASPSTSGITGKKRFLILGSGWSAARLSQDLDLDIYDLTVVSPQNHMAFTPLLPSAAVGSVAGRSTAVSMRDVQPKLKSEPHHLFIASALDVDPDAKQVRFQDSAGSKFSLTYDVLAIATGSQGSTFGIPGVEEHSMFLRTVANAEAIRNKLISTWGLAYSPGQDAKTRDSLTHTLVVGGGPTGVEFAGELCDLMKELKMLGPGRVTIVEAMQLLGSFDSSLRDYAIKKLKSADVRIIEKGAVKELRKNEAVLSTGEVIPFGVCVWSTGVGPTPFIDSLKFAKTAKGRIAVDKYLRVLTEDNARQHSKANLSKDERIAADEHDQASMKRSEHLEPVQGVFAMGDCCAYIGTPLPALAQVAEQQGRYLAKELSGNGGSLLPAKPFLYKSAGAMASLGGDRAIIELGEHGKHMNWKGFTSYLAWKSAYFSKLYTFRNQAAVLANWIGVSVFGRDINQW